MVSLGRRLMFGVALGLLSVGGFALGFEQASAYGTCAGPPLTCWFDSECSARCYQFPCESQLCDEMDPEQGVCSVCVT
jgi:hypothetical protein